MLTYRRIDHEKLYAQEIWDIESKGPSWFVEASKVWTPTFESFRDFFDGCGEVWGLFDDNAPDRLVAVVYLEFTSLTSVNIHVSVLEKLPIFQIVRFFTSLTRHETDQGVESKTAWILERNRFLMDIARQSNYHPTGLKMDYGVARGRVLRWVQVAN